MARKIDTTQPLSEEDEAYLRERYSNQYVNHVMARAAGSDFSASAEPEDEDMKEGDNPYDFDVEDVIEFMSDSGTTDEERQRVLDAETEGLDRPEITGE